MCCSFSVWGTDEMWRTVCVTHNFSAQERGSLSVATGLFLFLCSTVDIIWSDTHGPTGFLRLINHLRVNRRTHSPQVLRPFTAPQHILPSLVSSQIPCPLSSDLWPPTPSPSTALTFYVLGLYSHYIAKNIPPPIKIIEFRCFSHFRGCLSALCKV